MDSYPQYLICYLLGRVGVAWSLFQLMQIFLFFFLCLFLYIFLSIHAHDLAPKPKALSLLVYVPCNGVMDLKCSCGESGNIYNGSGAVTGCSSGDNDLFCGIT